MKRKEIEKLCRNSEIEMVDPDPGITRHSHNKCGHQNRQGTSYPDLIELLMYNETKNSNNRNNRDDYPFMDNFFTGFNDVYFVMRQPISGRVNGAYITTTRAHGFYYAITNHTIVEDSEYHYITTEYDLYLNTNIVTGNRQMSLPRSITPTHIEEDEVALNLCRQSREQDVSQTNSTRHRGTRTYFYRNEARIEKHRVDNILPGIKSHACDTSREEITHVPNALKTCIAIKRELEVSKPKLAPSNRREYNWFRKPSIQKCMSQLKFTGGVFTVPLSGAANSEYFESGRNAIRKCCVEVKAVGNASHHKKHDCLYLEITGSDTRRMPAIAQIISTSEASGNLVNVLQKRMLDLSIRENTVDRLERKVLMSDKAGIDYYELSDEQVLFSLKPLCGVELTLIKVGEGSKSPKAETFSDLCQFGDGVYSAMIDRPIELVKDTSKIGIPSGHYVIAVPNIRDCDFLWYAGLATNAFADISIREIRTRLALNQGTSMKGLETVHRGRLPTMAKDRGTEIMPSNRIGQRNLGFVKRAQDDDDEDDDDDWDTGLGNLFG